MMKGVSLYDSRRGKIQAETVTTPTRFYSNILLRAEILDTHYGWSIYVELR